MQQWYQCPYCRAPVSAGTKFCAQCGNKLSWPERPPAQQQPQYYRCPYCGAPVTAGAPVCQQCRAPLYWPDQQQTQLSPSNIKDRPPRFTDDQASKPLKTVVLSVLGLLLFICLSAFGPVFLVKQTALNPNFVSNEVNKLELASLVNDAIAQQTSDELPVEIGNALSSLVSKIEPQVKEELDTIIHSVYDYLLGKRENPELTTALRNTFLSTDFIGKVIDELDPAPLVKPVIQQQLTGLIPQQLNYITAILEPSIDKVLQDMKPWIKEQLKSAAEPIADYLTGASDSFTIAVSIGPVVDSLGDTLLQDILESQIPGLTGLPQSMIESVFKDLFDQFSTAIPSSIEIDETLIGKNTPKQIGIFVSEAENGLREVREYVGYFQTGYILLIVFILLLIAVIVLLSRRVRESTRIPGIAFLASGVIELVGLLIIKGLASEQVQAMGDIPVQLQVWLKQVVTDVPAPLQALSIGFIVVGVALVAVSFIYRPSQVTS